MTHYYVIAERGNGRTWWLSFPDGPGIFSAADDAADIPAQAHEVLETMLMHAAGKLPLAIEAGARPPDAATLAEFEQPVLVVVVPFEEAEEVKAAA
jgi:predicted RNase H-like HicB family nuclease